MNIYAITPTGNRPEGLALLAEYLNAQTYAGPLTWIIVDDCLPLTGSPNTREGIQVRRIFPRWTWAPGQNTQASCMDRALDEVPDDAVLFVLEDDDILLPGYIETMLDALGDNDLIGERDSRYYNVATRRWRTLPGTTHASMASTVCRGDALELLRKICSSGASRGLDVTLWQRFKGGKRLLDTQNVVGIKGLPGRPGIGVGHRARFGVPDTGDKLREWAGDYADNYAIFRE